MSCGGLCVLSPILYIAAYIQQFRYLLPLLLQSQGRAAAAGYDPLRTLRMFGFGFCWYGPYQFYWYNLLDHFMPLKNTPNFLAKVWRIRLLNTYKHAVPKQSQWQIDMT